MEDLISVIVPVYNGERFLQRCLESLKKQTYENLEIILIDDGSTDGSYSICEQYGGQKGIRVFHQKHQGLAQARNQGIRLARGDYIGFCDADDYVNPFMYGWLYDCAKSVKADISVCGYQRISDGDEHSGKVALDAAAVNQRTPGTDEYAGRPQKADSVKRCDRAEAFEKLLRGEEPMKSYAWNKLYRRELFQDISYPPGKCYEDQFTTWRLVLKARNIALSDWKGYYYFVNPESITNRSWNEKELDYLDAWNEILRYCRDHYEQYCSIVSAQLVSACIYNLSRMRRSHVKNTRAEWKIRQMLADNLKGYWKSDIAAATWKRKLAGYFYGLREQMIIRNPR